MVNFITRSGSLLKNGSATFRYAGTNLFWLGIMQEGPRYPTHTEIDDALATVVEMGGTVVRAQSLGMPVGTTLSIEPTQNTFNDAAFEPIDYSISRCAALGLRLIIPLCDGNVTYMGSIQVYANWRGVTTAQFFTDAGCISDFETRINHILTHVNQYSGVAIKDDPTIMLWETGNELTNVGIAPANTWTSTIAAYIKSISPNALVADGFNGDGSVNLTSGQVAVSGVDAYTLHYYGAPYSTYASQISTATTTTNSASKVCYIGEWDWLTTTSGTATTMAGFCTTIETSSLSGDTFWSLFPHSDTSGYDLHNDGFSMYYPGATTDAYNRGQTLRTHAYTMSGVTKPAQETPTAPPFTAFSATKNDTTLTWSGVVAARFYQLERSTTSASGPWTVLSSTLPQDQGPYTDNGSVGGWYRVAGINGDAVKGAYSAIIGGTGNPPPPGGDPRNPYGVTIASRATPLKNIDPQVLADAVTLGLGWIRLQVRWIDIETSNGVYDFSVVDDCVSRCMALGLKVQFPIQTPPPWRVSATSCGPCSASGALCINGKWHPHDPTQTGAFADLISKRYNGVNTNNTLNKPLFIDSFEIGNEEMNNMDIPGAAQTYAAQTCKQAKWFIPVLQKCAPIIRTNSPNALVGMPGLIKSSWGHAPFMQDVYNNNCIGLFDYANIHTYPNASPNTPDNGVTLSSNIQEMVNVMNTNNDTQKDVWITEIGWQVPSQTSEANRQLYYTQMLDDMRTSGRVGAVNVFTMNYTDPSKNLSSTEYSLTHLASPQYTPTFGTFQAYIKKYPTWEDGSTTISTRDVHGRFKLKTSSSVQKQNDVAVRFQLRAPGVATQKIRDLSTRFRIRQVVGSGGVVKLPGQRFTNGVSNYIFGTNMSQDFATNTVRNTPLIQAQIAAGGFTVMRCNIPVSSTNAFVDETANACNACGTQMLVILDQTNATWNQSLVSYLGNRCQMYELGNEPDINGVTTAQYLAAWNSQIPALRAINPSAAFIGPALGVFSNVNSYLIPWLKGCVTSGNLPDGVSYHVYPCTASTCDQTCCTPKSGNFQSDAGTLRAAVQSVTSAPIALCLTEWNIDATNPPKAYTYANPFNTTWTEAALDSMVAGNLDLACQWDAAGNAGSGFDDLISTTAPYAQQVQYAPMVNRIARYAPSMPLDDLSTRFQLRLAGTTQSIRDVRARVRLQATSVPTPVIQDAGGRYRSRQIIRGGGGGKPTGIMVVLMENRSWQEIFGSGKGNWPLTNALVAQYANTTNFFGVFHPSLPNYIAILAGSRLGCNSDGAPGSPGCGPFSNNTIVDSLEAKGITWKAYFENMPSVGYTGGDTNGYVQHHNPFVYFSSITSVSSRKAKLVPLTVGTNAELITDLNAANPPQFVWVTPNIGDDGHTGGSPDKYITTLVSKVQQTNWYANGGAIIVVWDEGEPKNDFSGIGDAPGPSNGGGPTGMFVVSEGAKNFGLYTPSVNHYGMMKAVCEVFGITQLVDEAHTINGDISTMFGTTAQSTAPIDFYTRFRLQFPGHIRDIHARLHLTPGVTNVKIIGDIAARLRLGAVTTTNATKDARMRMLLQSATAHDTAARCILASTQASVARDIHGRVCFTFGSDTFIRANQAGWGVASDGETWVKALGAATPTITNNTGQITGTNGQQAIMLLGTTTVTDAIAQVNFTYSSSTTDGANLILRAASGASSYYRAYVDHNVLTLAVVNGTTTTTLATLTVALTTLVPYTLKFLVSGQNLSVKVWQVGSTEPDWMLSTTDTTLPGPGQYGIRTRVGTTNDLINYTNYLLTTNIAAQQKIKNVAARMLMCNDGDTFTRPFDFFGAWGVSTSSGSAWVQLGAFSVLNTTDTQGLLSASTGDTYMVLGTEVEADVTCYADLTLAATADTSGIFVRYRDTNNWYLVRYLNGMFELVASHDGARTTFASLPTTMSLGVSYTVRIQAQGTLFSAKIWATGTAEPAAWTLRTTDATYDGIGQWGLYGNASTTTPMRYDNFVAIALSRNVQHDASCRLTLQDFGTLDLAGRMVLLDTHVHDTRGRVVLGITATHDAVSRLRFATIKSNDIGTRARVLAATQRQQFLAGRMVLQDIKLRRVNLRLLFASVAQQKDTAQRLVLFGQPLRDTQVRVTIGVPKASDAFSRLRLAIANPRDVQVRLYTVPSPLLDTVSRVSIMATNLNDTTARVVMQTLDVRDIAQRFALAVLVQKNLASRTRLASPTQTKDVNGRFRLSTPTVLPRTTDCNARLALAIDQDTFIRANQSGWGTASGGSTWTKLVGTTYTQAISSNEGTLTGAASVTLYQLGADSLADVTVAVRLAIDTLSNTIVGLFARSTATTTNYRIVLTGGHLNINKEISGTSTTLASASFAISANTFYYLKVRFIGANISAKAWTSGSAEPTSWTVTVNDSSITAAGNFGIIVNGGANADVESYDSFVATNSQPTLVTDDIYARARFIASATKDTTTRFRLVVPSTQTRHDWNTRIALLAVHLQDAHARVRTLASNTRDMAARCVIQAGNIFDTPARLSYASLPVLHDANVRLPLSAQNTYPLLQRLRLQPSYAKDIQARLLTTSQVLPVTHDMRSRINMALAQDTFDRPNQSGWGNSSDGYVWTQLAGVSTLSIFNDEGRIVSTSSQPGTNSVYLSPIMVLNVEALLRITPGQLAGDSGIFIGISNGGFRFLLNSGTLFKIDYVAPGGSPVTNQVSLSYPYTAGTSYRLRARLYNNNVLGKVWPDGTAEPLAWTAGFFNTNTVSAGRFGVKSLGSNTSSTTFLYDNFVVYDASGLLETFDLPQRICVAAVKQPSIATRFPLTAIVNITIPLSDVPLAPSDVLTVQGTLNGGDTIPAIEADSVLLAYTTIDASALTDASSLNDTSLLVDTTPVPADASVLALTLLQSDTLVQGESPTLTGVFTGTDALAAPIEADSVTGVMLVSDTLVPAAENIAESMQSTLLDQVLTLFDVSTITEQVQSSDTLTIAENSTLSGVYSGADIGVSISETVLIGLTAMITILDLLQESLLVTAAVAISDLLSTNDVPLFLLTQVESAQLACIEAVLSGGIVVVTEASIPDEEAVYTGIDNLLDSLVSSDTLVIVAFSFMIGVDVLTHNEAQNWLITTIPVDVLQPTDILSFASTVLLQDALTLAETLALMLASSGASDSVVSAELVLYTCVLSSSEQLGSIEAILFSLAFTSTIDTLSESSASTLQLTALLSDSSALLEQVSIQLAEQLTEISSTNDDSSTVSTALRVVESTPVPLDIVAVVFGSISSDSLVPLDLPTFLVTTVTPSDSNAALDVFGILTLFSTLADSVTLLETTLYALIAQSSDALIASENTVAALATHSSEVLTAGEFPLLTLFQQEQETTPAGTEIGVFLNPSEIIGTDTLLLTESVLYTTSTTRIDALQNSELFSPLLLVALTDSALLCSEAITFVAVAFETVIVTLRTGTQTVTIRDGTIIARRRDGSTSTIRR